MDKYRELDRALENNKVSRCWQLLLSDHEIGTKFIVEESEEKILKMIKLLMKHGSHSWNQRHAFLLVVGNEQIVSQFAGFPEKVFFCFIAKVLSCNKPSLKQLCKFFIENGAKVNDNKECFKYLSPLVYAMKSEKIEIIEILLENGARPLQQYFFEKIYTLECAFSLPSYVVKNVVRYAALYVNNHNRYREFQMCMMKSNKEEYRKFGRQCIVETEYLKRLLFYVQDWTFNLYQFIMSKGPELSYYTDDAETPNNIFNLLSSKKLPIYRDIVLKQFEKEHIFEKLKSLTHVRWNANYKGKRVYLNTYCVENICKFLSKEDMINLLIASINFC